MAASPKNKRDKAWLGWFVVQILVIFSTPSSQLPHNSLRHTRHMPCTHLYTNP